VVVCAHALGHAHALDVDRMRGRIEAWAKDPATTRAGGQVVLLAAVLGLSAAVGLAVRLTGLLAERLSLASRWELLVRRRRKRWASAQAVYLAARDDEALALSRGVRADPGPRLNAYGRMVAIAWTEPACPTWSGDRLNTVAVRLEHDCHLAFTQVWPVLWLQLPEETRAQITAARGTLTRSADLAGWAALYAVLIPVWWPAAVVTVGLALGFRQRHRAAVEAYAALIENAVRLHARPLYVSLSGRDAPPVGPALGDALTPLLGS
jgi:hypothetical protein